MKKFILTAVAILGLSSFALAADNTIGVEYQWKQDRNTNKVVNQIQLDAAHTLTKNLVVDVLVQTQQERTGNTVNGRVEAGLTYGTPVFGTVSVGVRGGVAQQITAPENYYVYNIQPAVFVDLSDKVTGVCAYKIENSFDSKYVAKSQEWSAGATYKLSKVSNVGVTYFRSNLEDQSQGLRVGYSVSF